MMLNWCRVKWARMWQALRVGRELWHTRKELAEAQAANRQLSEELNESKEWKAAEADMSREIPRLEFALKQQASDHEEKLSSLKRLLRDETALRTHTQHEWEKERQALAVGVAGLVIQLGLSDRMLSALNVPAVLGKPGPGGCDREEFG